MSLENLIQSLPPVPHENFEAFGEVERVPLTRVQQLVGRFLGRNWLVAPHVTHHDEVDVTRLEQARKAWNVAHPERKLTLLPSLLIAVADALKAFPEFCASIDTDGKTLVLKRYLHVGVAVDTPSGLLVPVLHDVDRKSAADLSAELAAISDKARTKGLSQEEMAGGCFTISSLGHIGGTSFTPIINLPQTAILGIAKLQLRPAPAPDGGVTWRHMLPLSLSYDHRVINGAAAAKFVVHVGAKLAVMDLLAAA